MKFAYCLMVFCCLLSIVKCLEAKGSMAKFVAISSLTMVLLLQAIIVMADAPLADSELDYITAGGQPAVVEGGPNSTITFTPATDIAQDIAPFSQAGLRALVLNNVAGENQVANGMNVSSASQSGAQTNGQTNGLTQSWGSINDTTAVVVPAVTAVADANCNGALICKSTPVAIAIPGTIRVLSNTADQVVTGGANSSILYTPATSIAQRIDSNSQTNLTALVVNNVSGLNQVGNAINIQGSNVSLAGDSLGVGGGAGEGVGPNNGINP